MIPIIAMIVIVAMIAIVAIIAIIVSRESGRSLPPREKHAVAQKQHKDPGPRRM